MLGDDDPPPVSLRQRVAPLELGRLFVGPPHPHAWTLWLMATPLLAGAALFFDVFPREGPGDAWRLGWPVVVGVYSQADGFAVTRGGWAVTAGQLGLYAAGTLAVAWRQRRTAADPRVSTDA